MQTEFEFELPKGYVDQNGDLHKRLTRFSLFATPGFSRTPAI